MAHAGRIFCGFDRASSKGEGKEDGLRHACWERWRVGALACRSVVGIPRKLVPHMNRPKSLHFFGAAHVGTREISLVSLAVIEGRPPSSGEE